MTISLLQLNINADNYWDQLISYLTSHDFDILQLQEVAGKDVKSGNINTKKDCYKELQNILGDKYHSELAISQTYVSNPTSGYIGNATFYKKEFKLLEKNIVTLYERLLPFPSDSKNYEDAGRNVLHVKLERYDKSISFLNAHL